MHAEFQEVDKIQRVVAELIAKSPAGVKLLLIGGFRYRLLDNSQRLSVDIDYHWDGDLEEKRVELENYCKRVVLKEVKRLFGYEGLARKKTGPEAESPNAAFLELRFWKEGRGAVEIPIEITKIVCLDRPIMRTVNATVHLTPSDADVIEGKILAVVNRTYLQHRDFVDVFLHGGNLRSDSPERMKLKMEKLGITPEKVRERLQDFDRHPDYHIRNIQGVIDTQVEPTVALQMNAGGGGRTVFEESVKLIKRVCLL